MSTSLVVRWPLGVYQGRSSDGSPERYPNFARVFSALTHSAATGSLSVANGSSNSAIAVRAEVALRWLEQHPPVGMVLPAVPSGRHCIPEIIAYRKEGVLRKEGKSTNDKVTTRDSSFGTAFSDPVAWVWSEEMPTEVRETIDELCSDVGCLGESESIAILELYDGGVPTHVYSRGSGLFEPGGDEALMPVVGRLDALVEQHSRNFPPKRPTLAADRHNTSTMPGSYVPTTAGLVRRRLVPVEAETSQAPWSRVLLVPVSTSGVISADHRVGFAVAAHKALVARTSPRPPAVLTGSYLPGAQRPANKVALHWIDSRLPVAADLDAESFLAVMIPGDADPGEIEAITQALRGFDTLRSNFSEFELGGGHIDLDGADFWRPALPGAVRTWRTEPAAVPDRWASRATGVADAMAESARFSVKCVLRGLYRGETDSRVDSELRVLSARTLISSDPTRYVHRTNRRMPIMPYVTELDLGTLVGGQTVMAIGQSRHMGGGLLVPVDSVPVVDTSRRPEEEDHDAGGR